ncbi:MAG: TasA family protein [Eubacteriales bacterium]|nr:TasA family protein [Eubacteriales bacterium]
MNKKKILVLAVSVALVAILAIGGSLAYFTDTTETKTNEFTVGNVDIELSEPEWEGTANLMPGVTYPKDPTITVQDGSQDCWVFMKVEINKFNSWLRLVGIQNGFVVKNVKDGVDCGEGASCQGHINAAKFTTFFASGAYKAAFNEWFGGVDHDAWKIMNLDEVMESIQASWQDSTIKVVNPIFGYKKSLSAGKKVTLFTSVTMPASVTSQQLSDSRFNTEKANWKMNITAYAIQAAEIADIDAAYKALFEAA